jgi:hypothetical protein
MKKWAIALAVFAIMTAQAQSVDHLTPDEVKAAIALRPDSGFVYIEDAVSSFFQACKAQAASESIFTPSGWINARFRGAKEQYTEFAPSVDDTAKVLRVISRGCVNGTDAGPVCDTVDRAVLLSDVAGTAKVEAVSQTSTEQPWHNGSGATVTCAFLTSEFPMAALGTVQNAKGEFLIATFGHGVLLNIYTVKQKHLKRLGI